MKVHFKPSLKCFWERGMKRTLCCFVIVLLISWPPWSHSLVFAEDQTESNRVVLLPPIVVEEVSPEEISPKSHKINVISGVGAKNIDVIENELGVPLNNLEDEEDITLDRRLQQWWLKPSAIKKEDPRSGGSHGIFQSRWEQVSHQYLGRIKFLNQNKNNPWFFEVGSMEDLRWSSFKDSSLNPYDDSALQVFVQNQKIHNYFKFYWRSSHWKILTESDTQSKKHQLGLRESGYSKTQQHIISAKWNGSLSTSVIGFLKWRNSDFKSRTPMLFSNQSTGWHLGTFLNQKLNSNEGKIEAGISYESLQRTYSRSDKARFHRYQLYSLWVQNVLNPFWESQSEIRFHIQPRFSFDRSEHSTASSSEQKLSEIQEPLEYDLGMELTSNPISEFSIKLQWRNYSRTPPPSQKLGDGFMVVANNQLPSMKGNRLALGSWLQFKRNLFNGILSNSTSVLGFYETTENEPIMLATSPSTVKTMPLGRIQARGYEILSKFKAYENYLIQFSYTNQNAVNASSIPWQRGNPLPGRPDHTFKWDINYQVIKGWRWGSTYVYKSAEAMDLSNLWHHSPHKDLNLFFGYGTKTWEWRFLGSQLLSPYNEPPKALTTGTYGANLIDPSIETTEYKFLCEILL